jgi:hypothetical protein
MIKITTNIGKVVEVTTRQMENLANVDQMVRTAATSVLGMMKIRIHQQGLDANNQRIGTYSKGYMKIRTGNFANATRVSRGKNAGKLKDAGVFTKKKVQLYGYYDKGVFVKRTDRVARPNYHRSSDTTVIASLTREMENDEKVIALRTNSYGIGFSNKHNYDKSQWVEATYHRQGKIFAMSQEEIQMVIDIATQFTGYAFSE